MKKSLMGVMMFALAAAGSSACATKGFVKSQVGQVSSKVDSLSQSLEETQELTKQNQAKIGEVDTKAGAAQSSADQAGTAAGSADAKAVSAGTAAQEAGQKADDLDKASKRIIYEVVLNDSEGNFKFGTSELPDAAKAQIDDMVSKLTADPKNAYFEIAGYTDNVGPKEINQKLGMDRANAVEKYLYEQHHIPLFRMNVISYGSDDPVAPNNTKDGRAQNRRVVIRVLA